MTKTLTLLDGSKPALGKYQTIVLPEAHTDINAGDTVTLENSAHEPIGSALVEAIVIAPFARLTDEFDYQPIHPDTWTYAEALETMKAQVKGFSQVDPATLILARIDVLAAPGQVL
jgi:hypothetical protein